MKNVAILMAAGQGKRVGGDVPKQFAPVGNKLILEYSLQTFQNHPNIDEIVVVLPADYVAMEEILTYLFTYYPKISQILAGGNERFQSSWAAIQWFVERREDILLLHDAARPGLTERIINDILEELQEHSAVITALPATDTIVKVNEKGELLSTLQRSELYYAQTPQAFRAGILYDSFLRLCEDETGFVATDESSVVSHYFPEVPIRIVEGDALNFKITYPSDLAFFCQTQENNYEK